MVTLYRRSRQLGRRALAQHNQKTVRVQIPSATQAVDQHVFIADRAYTLLSIEHIYTVAGGASSTVRPFKTTGTEAPASGDALTFAQLGLDGTINLVATPTLTAVAADLDLATGDRISLVFTGTVAPVAGFVMTFRLLPLRDQDYLITNDAV